MHKWATGTIGVNVSLEITSWSSSEERILSCDNKAIWKAQFTRRKSCATILSLKKPLNFKSSDTFNMKKFWTHFYLLKEELGSGTFLCNTIVKFPLLYYKGTKSKFKTFFSQDYLLKIVNLNLYSKTTQNCVNMVTVLASLVSFLTSF